MHKGRGWFVNFQGIGNGIMVAPLLKCFENSRSDIKYFHNPNSILSNKDFVKIADLKNLNGFVPEEWRRFRQQDWDVILKFVHSNNIDLIINFRNEGPMFDISYYKFKEWIKQHNPELEFWDLNFTKIQERVVQRSLVRDLAEMLRQHGVDIAKYKQDWLASLRSEARKDGSFAVGFGIAASQVNKKWPLSKWIELAKLALSELYSIRFFPGSSGEEKSEMRIFKDRIWTKDVSKVEEENLFDTAKEIGKLDCFISNDTGLLHIAVALGIPTVGLYMTTDPIIWGYPDNQSFTYFINNSMFQCDSRKTYSGNCIHYYGVCPAIQKYSDTIFPQEVIKKVKEIRTGYYK